MCRWASSRHFKVLKGDLKFPREEILPQDTTEALGLSFQHFLPYRLQLSSASPCAKPVNTQAHKQLSLFFFYIHTCTHARMHAHVCTCTHGHKHVHTHEVTHRHTHTNTATYTQKYTQGMHAHMYTHTGTQTQRHTYTCAHTSSYIHNTLLFLQRT